MKIKFGALVTDGRGKIGGHVASKNRAGAYLRTKVTPVNPATSYQVNARARLSALSTAWRGLGAATVLLWNRAVQDFKGTDIFGDLRSPTGFNLYQKLNNNLGNVGVAPITTPPLPVAVSSWTLFTASAVHAGAVSIVFTVTPIPAGEEVELWATPAISPGISFVKSELRKIATIAHAGTSPYTATTAYNAKFGAVGAAGKQIFFQAKNVCNTTGQAGQPVMASCIIT